MAGNEQDEAFVPLPLATDLSSELAAGSVVGEYTIDRKLGDGGMATVYGATHPLIGKKAAIKVIAPALSLDAGLVERFTLEARAVNAIGHPNIVDVFSFGRLADGRSYFVMEWLQGDTLYDRMWDRRLGLDEALDILDQVCDALEAAHEKGIVHRDLKPANIFLCPVRGRRDLVKLLDFGVAKLISPSDDTDASDPLSRPPQTMTGQVVGTPDYLSPEQARAKSVDGKTDVYALGVIAWEMILGRRPFEADNSADVVRLHLSEAPPRPRSLWPEIPSPLDELLAAMLEKSAGKRPSPMEVRAIIRELRGTPPPFEWDGSSAPSLPPLGRTGEMPRSTLDVTPLPLLPRRKGAVVAAALALVAVVAAGAGVVGWRTRAVSPAAGANRPGIAQPTETAPTAPATAPVADVGTLVVHVDAGDARIELDGALVAGTASGARLRVGAGDHAVSVTAPGRRRYAGRVAVGRGATVELAVRLRREVEPPLVVPLSAPKTAAAPKTPAQKKRDKDPDYLVDPFSSGK